MLSGIGSSVKSILLLIISTIRTAVFYFCFALWTALWSTIVIFFIHTFCFRLRHRVFVKTWAIISVHLCRLICGVRWNVKGRENIPGNPCVIISNHQSTWETFFLQTLLTPQTQVIKHDLLKIPFFGWAFKKIKPIAINRKDARQALQQIRDQGKVALEHNVWVLIFPEGTRTPPGEPGKFSRGGADLAKAAKVDVLPIAHNAGVFWPNDSWLKRPGIIHIEIGPVVKTELLSVAEINDTTRNWIAGSLHNMMN